MDATTHEGRCFCGGTRLRVTGPAALQGFCHCTECREWSAGPITAYAIWPSEQVEILPGETGIVAYSRAGKAERLSCGRCGGAVATRIRGGAMTDVYPALLPDFGFEPAYHIFYAERMIDMADGLPKFLDMPETAGGSGRMADG